MERYATDRLSGRYGAQPHTLEWYSRCQQTFSVENLNCDIVKFKEGWDPWSSRLELMK